jgi:hypothetical protein
MVKLLKSFTEHPRVKSLGPGLITGAADDDPSGMGDFVIRPRLRRLGWAATAVMAVTVVAMMST